MAANDHARPCKAKNKRGEPCGSYAVTGGNFCMNHDPARAAQMAAARAKGGRARHGRSIAATAAPGETVRLQSVGDVLCLIERAVNDALAMENSLSRSRTLGTLALAALKAFEVSELENRIAALETLLKIQTPTRVFAN